MLKSEILKPQLILGFYALLSSRTHKNNNNAFAVVVVTFTLCNQSFT